MENVKVKQSRENCIINLCVHGGGSVHVRIPTSVTQYFIILDSFISTIFSKFFLLLEHFHVNPTHIISP